MKLLLLGIALLSLSACSTFDKPKPGHATSWTDDMLGSDTSSPEESFSSKMLKSNTAGNFQQVY